MKRSESYKTKQNNTINIIFDDLQLKYLIPAFIVFILGILLHFTVDFFVPSYSQHELNIEIKILFSIIALILLFIYRIKAKVPLISGVANYYSFFIIIALWFSIKSVYFNGDLLLSALLKPKQKATSLVLYKGHKIKKNISYFGLNIA